MNEINLEFSSPSHQKPAYVELCFLLLFRFECVPLQFSNKNLFIIDTYFSQHVLNNLRFVIKLQSKLSCFAHKKTLTIESLLANNSSNEIKQISHITEEKWSNKVLSFVFFSPTLKMLCKVFQPETIWGNQKILKLKIK